MFYRGEWCPFCDLTLRAFDKANDEFKKLNAQFITASPQVSGLNNATGENRSLSFPLYTDPHNEAARAFGVLWALNPEERALYKSVGTDLEKFNSDSDWELPAPSAFIIDKSGIVKWAWVNPVWTVRPEPTDILKALAELK